MVLNFHTKKYRFFNSLLTVFLPQLVEVQCPNCLDFQNPLGKVMKRSGLRFEHFAHKWCKIAAAKKVFVTDFHHLFIPFNDLFAPTSQSPTSNFFFNFESLRTSNGKKWSQILKL